MNSEFETLLSQHRSMMLSYARVLVSGDHHHAEDIVQESCVVAYKNLERYDSELGNFPSWLRGIVRNKALEKKRKMVRNPQVFEPEVIEGLGEIYRLFDDPALETNWQERITVLKECVQSLDEKKRSVIMYFYYTGYSLKEIAVKQSSAVMSVGQRLSRARKLI